MTRYLINASAIIKLNKKYCKKDNEELWSLLNELIRNHSLFSLSPVEFELDSTTDSIDEFYYNNKFFREPVHTNIDQLIDFRDVYDESVLPTTLLSEPFIVLHALYDDNIVIVHESDKSKIYDELKLDYISLDNFIRKIRM